MNILILLLGTNIGKRKQNLEQALEAIEEELGEISRRSGIYETQPWGYDMQPEFLNMAVEVDTDYTALECLQISQRIEQDMGRSSGIEWGPRVIDIDLIYFNDEVVDLPELNIPHPYVQERNFALKPLLDIIPEYMHPGLMKTTRQLLAECKDESLAEPWDGIDAV